MAALRRRLWSWLGILVGLFVLGLVIIQMLPGAYNTSMLVGIRQEGSQETLDYKYDGYYTVQAADKFAETVSGMFSSPEVVQDIFNTAELNPGTQNLRKLATIFDAKKTSAQTVSVKYQTVNEADARKILDAINRVIISRANNMATTGDNDIKFGVFLTNPIIVARELDAGLSYLLIALAAFILATGWVLLREGIKGAR